MKLHYNPALDVYLAVADSQADEKVFREIGLDKSAPATAKAGKPVYQTASPYAALALWDCAAPEVRDKLAGLRADYEASWRQESDRHIACPADREFRPFQKAGIEYALKRHNTIIGDQPGLGKTIQAIGIANECQMQRVLVACPASVRLQWRKEILNWSTQRQPVVYPILKSRDGVHPAANWTVISYDLARTDIMHNLLNQGRYDMIVLDELHYLKSIEAQRTRSIFGGAGWQGLAERAEKMVGLTGTLLPNRPRECYTALRSMAWDAIDFSSQERFEFRYNPSFRHEHGIEERVGRLPELQNRLRCNLMVRRMKRDVLPQLPAVQYELVNVEESADIRKAVKAERMLDIDVEALAAGMRMDFDGEISTVRREMGEAMAPKAVEHVERLLDGGLDKVLVFAWHRSVLDELEQGLGRHGVLRIDGSTSASAKFAKVRQFGQDPRKRVVIANIMAAGTGTDGLQEACSWCVFAEPEWTHGNNEQAVDRLSRMGQRLGVMAEFLVAPGSIAERVLGMAIMKARDSDRALDKQVI